MAPRIVFVVMSAVHARAAIDELAQALAPHRVLVHHDFRQAADFALESANAVLVPDPKRTGWACWGFSEGIFHSLRHALRHHEFDYLQLLSPTCLPIKPLVSFEAHVASSAFDAHGESIDLLTDTDGLMSVGYRAFSPEATLRHRALRRISRYYYRGWPPTQWRSVAGVALREGPATDSKGRLTLPARVALGILRAARAGSLGRHPFDAHFRPQFGSVWIGAQRDVIGKMIELYDRPDFQAYFSRLRIADEFLVPTLLAQASARRGPSNHLVNRFDRAHPCWFDVDDFNTIAHSPAFFARKFRDDPADPSRRRVLDELVRSPRLPIVSRVAMTSD